MDSLPDMSSIRKTGFTPEADSGAVHDAPRVQPLSQQLQRRQRLQEKTGENLDQEYHSLKMMIMMMMRMMSWHMSAQAATQMSK